MRRNQGRPATEYDDYSLKNILIAPEGVVVAVDDRPGRLAVLTPNPSQTLQVGDRLRVPGELYLLEEFVCSTGFHNDTVQIWRVTNIAGGPDES